MIFPTDSVSKLRGELEDRVSAGELSEAEAYREALAADPQDPRALRLLALLAEDEGEFSTALDLAWRWLRADPLSHEVFNLIGRLLSREGGQSARAAGYAALGAEKLHFDPEADENPHPHPFAAPDEESPEVSRELEPHRLLHEMWTASTGELDRELITRILARGSEIAPLLVGVLNLYGEDLLDDVDDALVVRSVALLGEVGDASVAQALARFLPLEDETFSDTANWAFQRLSFRMPVQVLQEIQRLIATVEAFDLAAFTQQISVMPDTPGRTDAFRAIEKRLPDFTGAEHSVIVLGLLTGTLVMEGLKSPLAAEFERSYGDEIPADALRELKDIRKSVEDQGPYVAHESDISVYDICCPEFEPLEEDEPYVRPEPKIGRNDLCWCGSGKKYKKCHLAADESR